MSAGAGPQDAADFLAMRQHFRDIANNAKRAEKRIVTIADAIDTKHPKPTAQTLQYWSANVASHVRGIRVLLNVIDARLGTDQDEAEPGADHVSR